MQKSQKSLNSFVKSEFFSRNQKIYETVKSVSSITHRHEISIMGCYIYVCYATFWILLNTKNFNQSIIGAINLGNDTDTVGACVGGLAGIIYGIDNINQEWKKDLLKYEYIEKLCNSFNVVLNK